jgi:hypothetical protein
MQYNFGHYLPDIGDGQFFFKFRNLTTHIPEQSLSCFEKKKKKESIYGKIWDIAHQH